LRYSDLHFSLDISRVHFGESYFQTMSVAAAKAFKSMDALEKGAIANPDEKRRVGHYLTKSVGADPEDVFHLLTHLASNQSGLSRQLGDSPSTDRFECKG
jgi:glucose-6-phosphate isomerase